MLQFDPDLAEDWVLKLWEVAPTPAKAARLRQAEVEKFLKRHRIRRIGATEVLAILKEQVLIVDLKSAAKINEPFRIEMTRRSWNSRATISCPSLPFSASMRTSPMRMSSARFLAPLKKTRWFVYSRPFAGPRAVLAYLAPRRDLEPAPDLS
jgi:hypothetical protein